MDTRYLKVWTIYPDEFILNGSILNSLKVIDNKIHLKKAGKYSIQNAVKKQSR